MREKNWNSKYDAEFKELTGKTLIKIEREGNDKLTFFADDESVYQMMYYQDCCASCEIEDICGDLEDLIGSPILLAEEVSSRENPDGVKTPEYQESFTWTFYKLSTLKGSVTIRWYGESNGHYSESVTFEQLKLPKGAA